MKLKDEKKKMRKRVKNFEVWNVVLEAKLELSLRLCLKENLNPW